MVEKTRGNKLYVTVSKYFCIFFYAIWLLFWSDGIPWRFTNPEYNFSFFFLQYRCNFKVSKSWENVQNNVGNIFRKMAIKREGLPIILLVGRKLLKIFKYYFSE